MTDSKCRHCGHDKKFHHKSHSYANWQHTPRWRCDAIDCHPKQEKDQYGYVHKTTFPKELEIPCNCKRLDVPEPETGGTLPRWFNPTPQPIVRKTTLLEKTLQFIFGRSKA